MKPSVIHTLCKVACIGLAALAFAGCKKEARLQINLSDRFEGQTVELMNYADSTVVAVAEVKDGKAEFVTSDGQQALPFFACIMIDGRLRAFYVAEPGTAQLTDSTSTAFGTPLNDRFTYALSTLDSIENSDDMERYVSFSEEQYNSNKGNPLGDYFCIEWLKYANPSSVDSLLQGAPETLRVSQRVKYYENFARHRAATSPGRKFTDFTGEDANGRGKALSSEAGKGKYTLIDFWASWCPYCIKELPDLASLYSDFREKGLEIVGVAVRDKPEDTKAMVEKYEIGWPVIYNTQKVPYDIYGFSGIPHHILLDPEGVIISRGENTAKIRERLEELLPDAGE